MSVCHRRHSGEDGVEEDESKKSKRHRNDKDRSSDKRDDDDRWLHSCKHRIHLPGHLVMLLVPACCVSCRQQGVSLHALGLLTFAA